MANSSTEISLVQSPFCRELRSKKYYFVQGVPTEESDIVDGSNHCWCSLTMQAIGPDAHLAHATDCKPGRDCYRSLFDENA